MYFWQRSWFANEVVKFAAYCGELVWDAVRNDDHFAFGDPMLLATFNFGAAEFVGRNFLCIKSFSTGD